MSVYVTTAVWEHSRAQHSDLLTLLALSDSASKDEAVCYPSQRSLAVMTKLGERTVGASIRALEEAAEIEIRQAVRRRTRINVYRVLLGKYERVEIDADVIPFRLLEPFSTAAESGRPEGAPLKGLDVDVTVAGFTRDEAIDVCQAALVRGVTDGRECMAELAAGGVA